jgi:hypothetical protein
MDFAARYGHFEVIEWLYKNRGEGFTSKAIDLAAENGELEIVEWLRNKMRI